MNSQIVVTSVSKSYRTHIRKAGFLNGVKDVFNRKYEYIKAVKNLSFQVGSGEILGLVGMNGAGKTTLIKMMAGVIKPDSGTILINNENPFLRRKTYRNSVALIMGQKGQLDVDLSISDTVSLYAQIYSISKTTASERMLEMAETLGLTSADLHKQVRSLSLGQRMKGELILAFLHLPKIVFLDEPTLGLDFSTQNAIRNYIREYKRHNQASIILTSHYTKDIEELCDRIIVINHGECLFEGTTGDLRNITPQFLTIRFSATQELVERLRNELNVTPTAGEDGYYRITFDPSNTAHIIETLTKYEALTEFKINDDTLDMLIESLYKANPNESI